MGNQTALKAIARQTKLIMGMPVTVAIVGQPAPGVLDDIFDYCRAVDKRFSTYKLRSEISRLNRGLPRSSWSPDMRRVLQLCEQTKRETGGYFDINRRGQLDPSGLVKGWAIRNAARRLRRAGYRDFYIEAGGDIQAAGKNQAGELWQVGIRNPFQPREIIKTLAISNAGVATSGSYERGPHIYNPFDPKRTIEAMTSLTVVAADIYEADRFATAAFAMGSAGIGFIAARPGLEGYMIDAKGLATYTNGFEDYVAATD